MNLTRLIDLPDIAGIEIRVVNWSRLMVDERLLLQRDINDASIKLFGIRRDETYVVPNYPNQRQLSIAEWEKNFEFLDYEYDEEDLFWNAFGIDVNDDSGCQLECMAHFDRQMVCAVRQLLPAASLRFQPHSTKSDEQFEAEAIAWARTLFKGVKLKGWN